MRAALFSDIHSNEEALGRAVEYLKGKHIDETWVLGDTIGYGANPNECFHWMLHHARVALAGNHERAVVDGEVRDGFTPVARRAIEWTAEVLKPEYQKKIPELHFFHLTSTAAMTHGSPDEPQEFRYLFSFADARESFHAFETPLCFVGHTHVPSIFQESTESSARLSPGVHESARNERYILNPGSVGQPRDHDPRLSFGIFDDREWTFELVRLEYNNVKAADKIRKAGLPDFLADRLL